MKQSNFILLHMHWAVDKKQYRKGFRFLAAAMVIVKILFLYCHVRPAQEGPT